MKTRFFGISIFLCLLFASCTLNSTQEQALNRHISLYLKAINEGSTLAIVSLTYPDFVKHVKNQGKDFFKSTFTPAETDYPLTDIRILQTERRKNHIHVHFKVAEEGFGAGNITKEFAAISENDGVSWFFMPYPDYLNKKICKDLVRIIR